MAATYGHHSLEDFLNRFPPGLTFDFQEAVKFVRKHYSGRFPDQWEVYVTEGLKRVYLAAKNIIEDHHNEDDPWLSALYIQMDFLATMIDIMNCGDGGVAYYAVRNGLHPAPNNSRNGAAHLNWLEYAWKTSAQGYAETGLQLLRMTEWYTVDYNTVERLRNEMDGADEFGRWLKEEGYIEETPDEFTRRKKAAEERRQAEAQSKKRDADATDLPERQEIELKKQKPSPQFKDITPKFTISSPQRSDDFAPDEPLEVTVTFPPGTLITSVGSESSPTDGSLSSTVIKVMVMDRDLATRKPEVGRDVSKDNRKVLDYVGIDKTELSDMHTWELLGDEPNRDSDGIEERCWDSDQCGACEEPSIQLPGEQLREQRLREEYATVKAEGRTKLDESGWVGAQVKIFKAAKDIRNWSNEYLGLEGEKAKMEWRENHRDGLRKEFETNGETLDFLADVLESETGSD
ncbi:hypothetical protein F4778DRAFT_781083 [Xylariomycetidae sp. FL2044]|nr:hypothetical protein F4778DRAFT_781083 [Xylariomycetidae sp. FL2044]